jgi:hypothetical protein
MDDELRNLIQKLYNKIEVLEKKIDTLTLNSNKHTQNLRPPPPKNLTEWVSDITVSNDAVLHIMSGTAQAFQTALKPHITSEDAPIYKHNNKLYVFGENNEWSLWEEENLKLLIGEIWRKFIRIHLNIVPDNEDIHLAQKKHILDMRRTLFDVKKNRHELNQWLKGIL